MSEWRLQIPEPLEFLLYPLRYKGAYGGRGSAKSWTFARVLLKLGLEHRIRVLCAREIMRTIKDSVHKLLADQIELENLQGEYDVFDSTIIHRRTGSEFLFTGLLGHTVTSLKSYEGVDVCWIEEAQAVSERSFKVLIPTIRKDNSEIWLSFNPDLETDPVSQRFIVHPPPDSKVVKVNWRDNPWFNDILNKERLHCLATDPDNYPNIWEGEHRPAVEGAVYYKEMLEVRNQGRVTTIPYDPMLKVHQVWDLGYADNTVIALVQKHLSSIRVIKVIKGNRRRIDEYSAELKKLNYNWGKVWLPHDGFSADVKTGLSTQKILQAQGWDVPDRQEITEVSVDEGIRIARLTFPRVYFDEKGCESLIEDLKRYRRKINRSTEAEGKPVHDDASDGADCFRYICVNIDNMHNEDEKPRRQVYVSYRPLDAVIGI
jgi:phage terminase large subunit